MQALKQVSFFCSPFMDANARYSRRLLPTNGNAKRAAVNFSILRSYA